MRSLALIGTASLSIFTASMTMSAPAINRIETVGSTNLQGRVGTPFLMPGIAKDT